MATSVTFRDTWAKSPMRPTSVTTSTPTAGSIIKTCRRCGPTEATSCPIQTWQSIQSKTMKTLRSIIVGLRPVYSTLVRRITFPLLVVGAGLVLIHPCAGQSGTWTATGSLAAARAGHTVTLLPNGKVLVVGGINPNYLAN